MNGCVPYTGGDGRVVVYDTWAKDRTIHFDVMLGLGAGEPAERESDMNRRALAAAKDYLTAMSLDASWVTLSGCSRCHVDNLAKYGRELWELPGRRAWIWPISGCPKPGA